MRSGSLARGLAIAALGLGGLGLGLMIGQRVRARPLTRRITIGRPATEVYEAWRDLSKIPHFMHWVEAIDQKSARRSHWRVRTPAGERIGWDAEIIEDIPGERLAWHTLGGARLPHRATVLLREVAGGTEVTVEIFGQLVAGSQLSADLAELKALVEAH